MLSKAWPALALRCVEIAGACWQNCHEIAGACLPGEEDDETGAANVLPPVHHRTTQIAHHHVCLTTRRSKVHLFKMSMSALFPHDFTNTVTYYRCFVSANLHEHQRIFIIFTSCTQTSLYAPYDFCSLVTVILHEHQRLLITTYSSLLP